MPIEKEFILTSGFPAENPEEQRVDCNRIIYKVVKSTKSGQSVDLAIRK